LASGLEHKYAVKQVDRLLTNIQLNVWRLFDDWVPYVVSERTEIVVSIDWTEFEADDHSPLVISLQTNHGRAHQKSLLKGPRNAHERALLTKLRKTFCHCGSGLWRWLYGAGRAGVLLPQERHERTLVFRQQSG
jgi:hypothetical protein